MSKSLTQTDYDKNASHYDQFRRPSQIILEKLKTHFSKAKKPIISIGCGTAQMEFELSREHTIFGLDRSKGMLQQAQLRINKLTQGDMTALPFKDGSFSGGFFMQSLHHVGANQVISSEGREVARRKAIGDALRTIKSGPVIIIQRDPSQNSAVWFWQYFPQALEVKLSIQPKVATITEWLNDFKLKDITATPINDPMSPHFFDPESPLDPSFRRSFSDFSYLSDQDLAMGLERLQKAIQNKSVHNKIKVCKKRFEEIGGTVYLIHGMKTG